MSYGNDWAKVREWWKNQAPPLHCARCSGLIRHPRTPGSTGYDPLGLDVGHVVDRADGGTDTLDNSQPEHARCNRSAGGTTGMRKRYSNNDNESGDAPRTKGGVPRGVAPGDRSRDFGINDLLKEIGE